MSETKVPYVVTQDEPHKPPLLFWKAYSSDMTREQAVAAYCKKYHADPATVQVQQLNVWLVGPCEPARLWQEVQGEGE